MVAEMRSGQGMRTPALSLVAGQLSHNALPLRPFPPYIIFGMANGWIVETLDATVTAEIEALPTDVRGRLNRVVGLIQSLGLGRVGMPHVKHIEVQAMGNSSDGPGRHSASALRNRGAATRHRPLRLRQEDAKDPAARDRAGAAPRPATGMTFNDLHREWMKDPEYQAAHAASEEEFALVSALIGARAEAGLSQNELAERMSTSQAAIARLESGRYWPTIRTLRRLAEATGTRLRVSFVKPEA
jgi:DNA-binding XRE family transcriptional regulator